MEPNKKKEVIVIIIGAIVVVLVVLGVIFGWFGGLAGPVGNNGSSPVSAVPPGTVAPDVNATGTAAGVAIPQVVVPAAPGATSQLRVFNITADNGIFDPSTVIVNQNDNVTVNFKAVDKAYDITFPAYGMYQEAAKGQTKILAFQAVTPGKFPYYCASCGNSSSSPDGYIIVVPTSASPAK
ncbi:cupredoxin domain-containing protein [Patescibacteria group bacterium]|nr:cupredoxin domain-containing protein [Patescibacteria group bacterium]